MINRQLLSIAAFTLLVLAAAAGLVTLLQSQFIWPEQPVYAAVNDQSQQAIVQAVRRVTPAVVNIDTVSYPTRDELPPLFREFFGPEVEPFPREGVASGVVVDPQGYILTNYHVVRRADRVTVTFSDGKQYPARIVGTDAGSELALVRVQRSNLPVVPLGSAASLPVGSWLIAVGSPFRLQNTVTVGVLSARGRTLRAPDGRVLSGLIQTDAAINPGNSGGALVDLQGRLVGIPTAIIGAAQGIGFAVSVDEARPVLRQLMARGRVVRPWLGVYYAEVTPELQRELGLPRAGGVAIVRVLPESPAAQAGLQAGDLVTRANGRQVQDPEHLRAAVTALRPGEVLTLEIVRKGQARQVRVRVGEAPAQVPEARP